MRIPIVLATLLVLSAALVIAPSASAGPDPCQPDPVTGFSQCDWTCGGALCLLSIVLFPCEQPWIHC